MLDPPPVRLAQMPGFDDDAAYVRAIADRASQLGDSADQANEPAERIALLLAAANLILAHQLEPACTSAILQIVGEQTVVDGAQLRSALDRADAFLDKAAAAIREPPEQDDPPTDWLHQSTERLETLQAFASGLRAYLLTAEGAEAERQARRAASDLSPPLEDQDALVAAAATFWQACLRSRESDPLRALSVLDLALTRPSEQSMPYAFFARLQRCRVIADHGGTVTALALLLQIEERLDDWITSNAQRADATRASLLVQVQILADWHDRAQSNSGSPAERQWCADRIKALSETGFGEGVSTVLRLTPAIPIIAPVPEPGARATGPTPEGN